jgi:hypothetical protein
MMMDIAREQFEQLQFGVLVAAMRRLVDAGKLSNEDLSDALAAVQKEEVIYAIGTIEAQAI